MTLQTLEKIESHKSLPWSTSGFHILVLIIVVFVAMRLPTMWFAPGGQDEEWYGIPGLTIAEEGIPRVPYSRATDQNSVFLGAEEMLFAQPPLSFYASSPFFMTLPGTYGTARLASMLAAILSIACTFAISKTLVENNLLAWTAAWLYSLSRLCFFPAMVARPDMICGLLGLLSILAMLHWQRTLRTRFILVAAVFVGLAGLTHPFAIVFAIQLSTWTLIATGTVKQRLQRTVLFCMVVGITFAMWLPLIGMRPDLFRSQFIGNILRPAGPGLLSRMVMPWESMLDQVPQLIERAHVIQLTMLAFGTVATLLIGWKHKLHHATLISILTLSGFYLLIVCLGEHPIQGFWCTTASLGWICFSIVLFHAIDSLTSSQTQRRRLMGMVIFIATLAMIPGSGIRTIIVYATHFGDLTHDNANFVRNVLNDLPSNATLTVGPEFSLVAYAEGWDVILACRHPMYFDSAKYPTEYYLMGRRDLDEKLPMFYDCELVRSYGSRDDEFSNYLELYVQRSTGQPLP